MSRHTDRPLTIRRSALLLYWGVMFLATHWPELDRYKPETGWPIPAFETVMHVGVYAVWVGMWWLVLSAGGRQVSQAAVNWLVLGGTLYAAFDETTQALVGRNPSLQDFAADLVGLIVATVLLQLWQRFRTARPAGMGARKRG